jgi:hypothetical protein
MLNLNSFETDLQLKVQTDYDYPLFNNGSTNNIDTLAEFCQGKL